MESLLPVHPDSHHGGNVDEVEASHMQNLQIESEKDINSGIVTDILEREDQQSSNHVPQEMDHGCSLLPT